MSFIWTALCTYCEDFIASGGGEGYEREKEQIYVLCTLLTPVSC